MITVDLLNLMGDFVDIDAAVGSNLRVVTVPALEGEAGS